jgi:diguanylate cyclase (GGDEF)-like protein
MVSTAAAAIAAVAEEKPDLVVMDAALGEDDDGVKTAMQMRLAHNVALVFLSATDDEDTLRRVLSVSPSGYLFKPVRARDLKVTLELALRRHKREADERHSLQSLAQTDSLTGLSNRRHLDETLADEWNRCGKEGKSLGVLMVDIDHFKQFNDSFGHMAGDLCLARVAETLKAACPHPTKTVGRWGGEEFLVILPDSDAQATQRTGEFILQAVRESGDASTQALSQQPVTISVGAAATLPAPGATPRDLIHLADMRLYAAKRGGRNQVSGGPPLAIDAPSTPQS